MANLRDIKNRIDSVQKTQKIVRAMKMVSAAKLARATQAIMAARPYAEKLAEVLGSVASGVEPDVHPLLTPRDRVRRLEVVLFTSDRGLCGAYNANLIKHAEALMLRRQPDVERITVVPVGRRGADYFRKHVYGEIPQAFTGLPTITPEYARGVAEFLMRRYEDGEVDETVLVYSTFHSALSQYPGHDVLLPVRPQPDAEGERDNVRLTYEVEPDPVRLLGLLAPRSVEFQVFRALLENQAGEHGARMTAMDNATNNTEELISTLTIDYNKARQAAITAELVEIVSGAEAL